MKGIKPLSHMRKWLNHITKQNIFLIVISFLIALFAWAFIASSVNPDYSKSFNGLDVTVDTAGTQAEGMGLSVLDSAVNDLTVDVTIAGNRTDIGGLNKSDLIAYVDFSTVTDTVGKQTFPIRLKTTAGTVLTNCTFSQPSIELTMDKYETRTYAVTNVQYPNITASDDDVIIDEDNISCDPATVSIYGPTSQLSQIDHISVIISDTESLYQTKTYTDCTEYELVDADGKTIAETAFQVQATRFSVKIPVYYTHTLPVTIGISNVPGSFDIDTVMQRLRISTDHEYALPGYGDDNLMITIETDDPSNKSTLDAMDSMTIGTIPLSSLSIGSTPIEIVVTLDEGYTDLSNLGTVYVSLDDSDLVAAQRWITNSEIQLINGSSNFSYAMQSGRTSITLIGPPEAVAQINADDLQATVNLYNAAITEEGTSAQAVTITLPDSVSNVWVSPQPKVNITVTFAGDDTDDTGDE